LNCLKEEVKKKKNPVSNTWKRKLNNFTSVLKKSFQELSSEILQVSTWEYTV
jgi:hypothetical protein